jgi:hypothetical protein
MIKSFQAAKVLSKFRIGGSAKCRKDAGSIKDNCATDDNSRSNTVNNENDLSGSSVAFLMDKIKKKISKNVILYLL